MANPTNPLPPPQTNEVIVVVEREMTARQKLWLVFLVVMKRARFFAILAGIGLFIGYWDTVKLHWDRWTHPRVAAVRDLPEGKEFFCPMDPQVTRAGYESNGDVPNCPICGMPLSLHDKPAKEALPPGITGRVTLTPERIAMAGIKTATIGSRPMARQTMTVGYVTYDESRMSRVVSRVEGYVEKLYVDKTFTLVHKGDPLAEIYSPELYSTARELVIASKGNVDRELAASSRTKLLLLGVNSDDIDHMVASGEAAKQVMIRSPQSGYVVDKKIVVGASIEPKMTLLEIADLSSVWVEAEIYEKDLAFLSPGQLVEAKVDAWPERTFRGSLAAIYPQVDAATRTNRMRVRLDNADGQLRPGMYADVMIDTPLETIEPYKSLANVSPRPPGEGQGVRAGSSGNGPASSNVPSPRPSPGGRGGLFLAVPESAVIDTGAKKIVYIERAEGQFEGVEVELGPRHGNFYPVLKGLAAGDKVAAAGSFLVDAETRLNPAAASVYFGASGRQTGAFGAGLPTPPNHPTEGLPGRAETSGQQSGSVGDRPQPLRRQPSADDLKNIDQLPEEDRAAAKAQAICPVQGVPLGSMGVPVKITLRGKTVFVCCKGCVGKAKNDPEGTLKTLESKKLEEK
jgi:Cu(I)/Ag(I) efflux system membrane fusion protein